MPKKYNILILIIFIAFYVVLHLITAPASDIDHNEIADTLTGSTRTYKPLVRSDGWQRWYMSRRVYDGEGQVILRCTLSPEMDYKCLIEWIISARVGHPVRTSRVAYRYSWTEGLLK